MPRLLSGLALGLSLLASACQDVPQQPLVKAAADGRADEIARLLAAGGDPNQRDQNGVSALAWAASHGHAAVVQALAKAGADLNGHDWNENRWTPLLHAIHMNQKAMVRVLLDLGANPSSDNPYGSTPLTMAAGHGHTDIVGWLLDAGADPYVTQKNGQNVLAAAVGGASDIGRGTVGECRTDTVRLLLQRAPALRMPDTVPGSVSTWAARIGNCQEILDLIKAGPPPARQARDRRP